MKGATEEQITAEVGNLSLHYPQPQLAERENESRWEDWFDDFTDVPPDILTAACREWRRSDARFAPAPGQLLKLCVGIEYRQVLAKRAAACIEAISADEGARS